MKKHVALALITVISPLAMHANPLHGLYGNIGAGAVFPAHDSSTTNDSSSVLYAPTVPSSSLFTMRSVHWTNDYQTGFEVNGAIGKAIDEHWRMEGEFLYQNMNRDIGGTYTWEEVASGTGAVFATQSGNPIAESDSTVNVYSLMANGYYDFKNSSKWTPFAGAGIGIAWIQSDDTASNNTLLVKVLVPNIPAPTGYYSPSLYGTAFAWQIKLGLDYEIKQNLSLDLMYRLFGTTDFKTSSSRLSTNEQDPAVAHFVVPQDDVRGLLNNSVNVSVRYKF